LHSVINLPCLQEDNICDRLDFMSRDLFLEILVKFDADLLDATE
jgi:hypothetical protein